MNKLPLAIDQALNSKYDRLLQEYKLYISNFTANYYSKISRNILSKQANVLSTKTFVKNAVLICTNLKESLQTIKF